MQTYLFIDCEYAYTSSQLEGHLVPSYHFIMEFFRNKFKNITSHCFHVGDEKKKKGLLGFLVREGINYNISYDTTWASRPQLIGATMGIEVMKYLASKEIANFVFLSGVDYMVAIMEEMCKLGMQKNAFLYYFNPIFSRDLSKLLRQNKIEHKVLGNKYFTRPQ